MCIRARCTVELDAAEARLRASFYAMGAVLGERPRDTGGWELDLRIGRRDYEDLSRRGHLRVLPGSADFRPEALQ